MGLASKMAQEQQGAPVALGTRMKEYENASESRLDPYLPFMIRLDGHCFSKFTKQFKKPYDERIHYAMVNTTAELVAQFSATLGYTHSDEITLVFPGLTEDPENPKKPNQTLMYNGRIQKIATLAAGYCSVRFNVHLQAQPILETDPPLLKSKMLGGQAYFDARVFSMPNNNEVLNNILWRSNYDCQRNSVSLLALSLFGHKSIEGLSKTQMKEKMLSEKQVDWNQEPNWYKHGSLIKKELYDKECVDQKTQQTILAKRSRFVCHSFHMKFSDDLVNTMFSKYWNDVPPHVVGSSQSFIVDVLN